MPGALPFVFLRERVIALPEHRVRKFPLDAGLERSANLLQFASGDLVKFDLYVRGHGALPSIFLYLQLPVW